MRGRIDPGDPAAFVSGALELQIYGRISNPWMTSFLGGDGSTNPSQSAISQWGWVSTPCEAMSTWGTTAFVPGVLKLQIYSNIYDPGMGPYPSRAALAPSQPISNKTVRLQFPHRAGRCRPGGPPFPSPVCWICKYMQWFMSGDGKLSSPGGAGSTNPSQSAINQWDWGFHTVRGVIDPRDRRFRPERVGVAHVWKDLSAGMEIYRPRVALAHAGSMARVTPVPYEPSRKVSILEKSAASSMNLANE